MPRGKEFDPELALDRAVELFWRQGYAATSVADLVAHLGIGRASLYATFGSKHQLYVAALNRYNRTRYPSSVEILARPGAAIPAIRALLDAYRAPKPAGLPPGCLMVNAAAECWPDDEEVRRQVEHDWNSTELALASALLRARARGELRTDADPMALARFLLVVLQGVSLVGKLPGGRARARDALDQAFDALRRAQT